jgi:ribosome-associated protein
MIEITPALSINEDELHFDFIRSAGPGGQNVNKVATAVQLRFPVCSSSLPEEIKARLIHIAGKRVNNDGTLIIESKRFRTQEQNKGAAIKRLVDWIRKASQKPKARRKTKPTRASKQERLDTKKKRGQIKKLRQKSAF